MKSVLEANGPKKCAQLIGGQKLARISQSAAKVTEMNISSEVNVNLLNGLLNNQSPKTAKRDQSFIMRWTSYMNAPTNFDDERFVRKFA